MTIEIRPVKTVDDCRHVEIIQKATWTSDDFGYVPFHLLITAAKNGGVLLLAWEGLDPVGFVFSFVGRTPTGQFKHCSHMAAVLDGYQGQGIGYRLKLAQREQALKQGIPLITWTFDPTISLNAHFNLGKLGAVSKTYVRHNYDTRAEAASNTFATDRFQVDWWIESDHVQTRLGEEDNNISVDPDRILNPDGPAGAIRPIEAEAHFVEIPPNIDRILEADPALALAWQNQLRQIFEPAFNAGYTAFDFIRTEDKGYYYLTRAPV